MVLVPGDCPGDPGHGSDGPGGGPDDPGSPGGHECTTQSTERQKWIQSFWWMERSDQFPGRLKSYVDALWGSLRPDILIRFSQFPYNFGGKQVAECDPTQKLKR